MQSDKSFQIVLDEEERQYHPGETVTGHVEIQVDQANSCPSLDILVGWRVIGEVVGDKGPQPKARFTPGSLEPGQVYRYPFAAELPNGPYTYRGRRFNMEWAVEAEAEMSLGPKLEARRQIVLTGGPEPVAEPYNLSKPGEERPSNLEALDTPSYGTILGAAIGLLIGGVLGFAMMLGEMDEWRNLIGYLMGGFFLIMVLAGIVGLLSTLREVIARAVLGSARIKVETSGVEAGEWIYLDLELPPKLRRRLESVKVFLRCTERIQVEDEYDVYLSFIEEHVLPASLYGSVGERETLSLSHRFRVPDGAPPSFYTQRARVVWTVDVEVTVPGWSPRITRRAVDVVPAEVGGQATLEAQESKEKFSESEEDWRVPEWSGGERVW